MKKSMKSTIALAVISSIFIGCGGGYGIGHSKVVSTSVKIDSAVRHFFSGDLDMMTPEKLIAVNKNMITIEVEYDYSGGQHKGEAFGSLTIDKCSNEYSGFIRKPWHKTARLSHQRNENGYNVAYFYFTDESLIKEGFITEAGTVEEDICVIPTQNYFHNNMTPEDIGKIPSDQLQNAFFSYRELP